MIGVTTCEVAVPRTLLNELLLDRGCLNGYAHQMCLKFPMKRLYWHNKDCLVGVSRYISSVQEDRCTSMSKFSYQWYFYAGIFCSAYRY